MADGLMAKKSVLMVLEHQFAALILHYASRYIANVDFSALPAEPWSPQSRFEGFSFSLLVVKKLLEA